MIKLNRIKMRSEQYRIVISTKCAVSANFELDPTHAVRIGVVYNVESVLRDQILTRIRRRIFYPNYFHDNS